MKTTRSSIGLLGAVLAWGCASVGAATAPPSSSTAASDSAPQRSAVIEEGREKARLRCDPIRRAGVSWPEEHAVGRQLSIRKLVHSGGHVIERSDLSAFVSLVGKNLARYSSRPDIAWTFAVIANDAPDAFSAPGGYVFVTTGLLRLMENEAQLAGVLGHEIGHVVHKHALLQYRTVKADQCTLAVLGAHVVRSGRKEALDGVPPDVRASARFADEFDAVDLEDPGDGAFGQFMLDAFSHVLERAGHGRDEELEADRTALELIAFAGYDAAEYERLLASLEQRGSQAPLHPPTAQRLTKLEALRTGEFKAIAVGRAKPGLERYRSAFGSAAPTK